MALWGTMTAGEFVTRDFTWLAGWPLILNVLTHGSLAFELLYPVLIWVPILRPLMIAGAFALHLGIAFVAPGLTEFGLAMMAANLAFVSGPWLRSLVTGESQPALRVLFDGHCPRCRATMALAAATDPDRVFEPIDLTAVDVESIHPSLTKAACMRAMHTVRQDGRVAAGYDALRVMSTYVPLFWPFALLGAIPGVAWAGRAAYNKVAASRAREQPCTDEVCGISPAGGQASIRNGNRERHPDAKTPMTHLGNEEVRQP
jgi:predicted DCC family thiol-disulfide oxidoreductase YuxK